MKKPTETNAIDQAAHVNLRMTALSMAAPGAGLGFTNDEVVERAQRYYDFLAGKTTSAKPRSSAKRTVSKRKP